MRLMRSERGMSLAELLMALLILSIVITTSMAAFVERSRRQRQAREIIVVYQALANEAEYWRRIPFEDLEKDPNFRTEEKGKIEILESLGNYNTVVAVDETQPKLVKNVTLTVRWQGGKRQARLAIVRVDTGATSLW
jgi:prepilin-type N-terminal cleavage/methylation domain-containing protein